MNIIVPTLGRPSLKKSIQSLINQTVKNWHAYVIFDGVKIDNEIIIQHENIHYFEIEKTDGVVNQASDVRKIGIEKINNDYQWIGFLDDDDTLANDYVEYFLNEVKVIKLDVYIYRMINQDKQIFPSLESKSIIPCDIGISFIVNKNVFHDIQFENSHCEDYDFLKKVDEQKKLIMFSSCIKYFVKSSIEEYEDIQLEFENKYKVFLNGINPFLYLYYFQFLSY
ncbi:glycosyltransferase [Candidatus Woesearchaeota archaeon]|nr:glycosyltransferase [Candidatus Woesearchaeota archaeon]